MLKRRYLYSLLVPAGVMMAIIPGMMRDSGQITISIVGDIMLSRSVQDYLDQYGYDYPYEDVREIFLGDDLTIGNLECPISDDENSADKTKRFIFRADEENAAALKRAGFDCLSLANNHSMDYLSSGLYDTMIHLENNGLAFVGAAEKTSLNSSFLFRKKGITIGVLAYSMLPPEGFFHNEDKPTIQYISNLDTSRLEKDLAALDCDFSIVYFHWGLEYQPYKSESQEFMAKKAIDLGADLIVGAHPHVQQETELYNGKYIYYSLGNFIFDRQIPPGTDEGVILQVTLNKKEILEIAEIPVKIEKAKPGIVKEKQGDFIMKKKFKECYLAGEIEFEAIDEYSEHWGMSDTTERLGDYLGLTAEEEDAWVSDGEDALYELLEQQKQ